MKRYWMEHVMHSLMMNAKELADMCVMSKAKIIEIRSGEYNPDECEIKALEKALGIDWNALQELGSKTEESVVMDYWPDWTALTDSDLVKATCDDDTISIVNTMNAMMARARFYNMGHDMPHKYFTIDIGNGVAKISLNYRVHEDLTNKRRELKRMRDRKYIESREG